MADNMALSVIIPAFHEEENLRVLLPRLRRVLDQQGVSYEIIVVDTEVPLDNTREACVEHGVSYVHRRGGDSYGAAVRTGIEAAAGEWILFMDADGSHTPEFIPKLLAHRDNSDVVIASRYVAGGYTENSRILVLMSQAVNITYRVVLGLQCKEVSNSFKLYRAAMLKSLSLRCDNFDIIEEILFKLHRAHAQLRIREVPFSFKKRMYGKTKRNLVAFMLSYLYTLLRLRFGK